MALPSSGIITMEQLRAEFGGPTPIVLQDYYRGDGLEPNSTVNSGVPTTGTDIAINANRTLIDDARISYSKTGSGVVTMRRNGAGVPSNTLCQAGNVIHFEVGTFATTSSGAISVSSDGVLIDAFNYNVVPSGNGGFFQ